MSTQPHVLLAKRGEEFLDGLRNTFLAREWLCDVVTDEESLLRAVASGDYDILVTDLDLSGGSSLESLRRIRDHNPQQAVIVVRPAHDVEEVLQILREGALDFFGVPTPVSHIAQSVHQVVSARDRERIHLNTLQHIEYRETEYVFTTAELVRHGFPLVMLQKLEVAGIIDRNERLKIELAFQEALTNAIEHGNLELCSSWKDDFDEEGRDRFFEEKKQRLADLAFAERQIRINVKYRNDHVEYVIEDEGRGFEKRQKPSSVEKNKELYGRGRSIIAGNMDEHFYSKGGRRITMRKHFRRRRDGA